MAYAIFLSVCAISTVSDTLENICKCAILQNAWRASHSIHNEHEYMHLREKSHSNHKHDAVELVGEQASKNKPIAG